MPEKPSTLLILRHAEKPGNPSTDLEADGIHLSTQGEIRAAALAVYLTANFPKLDFLFASKQSRRSNRSIETITPLSQTTSLDIDSRFADSDYARLAEILLTDSRYANKIVLICWHHTRIPDLASVLGVPHSPSWPARIFDRIWMVDYKDGKPALHNNPQMLLYGDSSV